MTTSNLPKPNREIWEERQKMEHSLNQKWDDVLLESYLEIRNKYNWATALYFEGQKYGLKKWDETVLLPAVFDDFKLLTSSELDFGDRVVAIINNKEGVVLIGQNTWSWVLEPEYDYITYPSDIVALRTNNKWGIYNLSQQQFIIPGHCDSIVLQNGFLFCNGIGQYQVGERWGVIDQSGAFITPLYDEVDDSEEGSVKVRIGEQ
jgi:hypothetical protein